MKKEILLMALVVFFITIFSYLSGSFSGIEYFLEDRMFSVRPIDENIVIVAIDNESIERMGQWPWPREVFAEFFSSLEKYSPASVALDVVMAENSRLGVADDLKLKNVLSGIKYPVILPVESTDLRLEESGPKSAENIRPLSQFVEGKNISLGNVNLLSDGDGVVRRFPTQVTEESGEVLPSLAYEALKKGKFSLPLDDSLLPIERIVFSGPAGSIRTVPFWRVLTGEIPLSVFENKIIFVGATAPDLHDDKPTPFGKGTFMSGVEIHAEIANMLLSGFSLRTMEPFIYYFWLFLAALLPAVFFSYLSGTISATLVSALSGLIYLIFALVLFEHGVSVNLVHLNISWVLSAVTSFSYKYFQTDKEKRKIRNIFSKYVSADVLEELVNDPSKVKLGGEEREVTVFFSDVRSFTTLSEGMSPSQLTRFLNKYLTVMTNLVLKHRGVVDKYIGDAIMSFWGAPIENKNHAEDAIKTSLDMVEALVELNKKNKALGEPEIDIGIGLNSGSATVGNMGSEVRFDYTVMGDTVNLASRLEGQTKTYGVKIIISETTRALVSDEELKKVGTMARELDMIKVKGKKKPVTIFEVVPRKRVEEVGMILEDFNSAREKYYAGDFSGALRICDAILKEGNDGPTKVLKDRCSLFLSTPPDNWEGVFEMKTK